MPEVVNLSPQQLIGNPQRPMTPDQRRAFQEQQEMRAAVEAGKIRQAELAAGVTEPQANITYPEPGEVCLPGPAPVPGDQPDNRNPKASKKGQGRWPKKDVPAPAPAVIPPLPNQNPIAPPTTRAQYHNQQLAMNQEYPDVADLFLGKTGVMPLTGIVDPFAHQQMVQQRAAQAAPQAPQVVVVKTELPEKARAYKFTADTTAYVHDGSQYFPKDKVIYDEWLVNALLQSGCRTLVPVEDAENYIQCPQCAHRFPHEAAVNNERHLDNQRAAALASFRG